jgi:uncharacterized protein YndB with AHSA1/START domain
MQGEARIEINAPPEKVYEAVSDITRMGEWSPETYSAEWIGGASGPAEGARFRGRNKHGWMRWSTKPTVIAADPGREFAFDTGQTIWRYRLEPAGAGTAVTESFEAKKYGFLFNLVSKEEKREGELRAGAQKTLERLKAAVEGSV